MGQLGTEAFLWDPTANSNDGVSHDYFAGYDVQWTIDPPSSGETLVVPEVMGELIPRFYGHCRCVFWWLSVDNFFASQKLPLEIIIHQFPKVIHAAQSHYAKEFLLANSAQHVTMLTDYINESFIESRDMLLINDTLKYRAFDVAINPQKGFDRALKIIQRNKNLKFVRLENMNRNEVINTLRSSKIYIDLGNHPGVDRIPREAALLGCVVITNLRGSAGNQNDCPLEIGRFKFSDDDLDVENTIDHGIQMALSALDNARLQQKTYVDWILDAQNRFAEEVALLLQKIRDAIFMCESTDRLISELVTKAFFEFEQIEMQQRSLIYEREILQKESDVLKKMVHTLNLQVAELNTELNDSQAIVHLTRRERNQLERKAKRLEDEITSIKVSFLWRVTLPMRSVAELIKTKYKT